MSDRLTTPPGAMEATAAAFARGLRAQLVRFSADGGVEPEVRLRRARVRTRSTLYEFDVALPSGSRRLLVKTATRRAPAASLSEAASSDRPRFVPLAQDRVAIDLEYRALARIQEHVEQLGDPRFGAVRVLGRLPGHDAFAMEAVEEPSLRTLALARGRAGVTPADLERSFRHAGAWLRAYHGVAARDVDLAVRTCRDDFVRYTEDLAAYLACHTGHHAFFAWLTGVAAALARAHLPGRLPLAPAHGDYAMRNILVGAGQRVTVVDTLGRYRTCVYRDVGYFLGDLRCGVVLAVLRGRLRHAGRVSRHRRAFLAGYFGVAGVPEEAVGLYEMQAILERWASIVSEWRIAAGAAGWVRRAGLVVVSAWLRGLTGRAVRNLNLARGECATTLLGGAR